MTLVIVFFWKLSVLTVRLYILTGMVNLNLHLQVVRLVSVVLTD